MLVNIRRKVFVNNQEVKPSEVKQKKEPDKKEEKSNQKRTSVKKVQSVEDIFDTMMADMENE